MIQDIEPLLFDNKFLDEAPTSKDWIFVSSDKKILLKKSFAGRYEVPIYSDFENLNDLIYLFKIGSHKMYLCPNEKKIHITEYNFSYQPFGIVFKVFPQWIQFACNTAMHLSNWYKDNCYCGRCGSSTVSKHSERALCCPICKNVIYPTISPVIIVGIIDKDRLLLTKYAHADFKQYGLIAGYVEIGETLEVAVKREVFEEVGLKVENIRYFGSQPWGENHILISGFFADLKGGSHIQLDYKELSIGKWFYRHELPRELNDISITYEMIEAFRNNKVY